MGIIGKDLATLFYSRSDGVRAAISILLASRERIDAQRTMNRNALNALIREVDLGIDARKALTDRQITEIKTWRLRSTDTMEQRYARSEAVLLATAVRTADEQLKQNREELAELDEQLAPGLQAQPGLGPVTVGTILVAYFHRGRVRPEASFAALVGTAPLQASSDNTVRHRLNRNVDRRLNVPWT